MKSQKQKKGIKIAIVGSRDRKDKNNVQKTVDELSDNDIVISGGCRGVDTWAIDKATEKGMETKIYNPSFAKGSPYHTIVKAFYSRNEQIAKECDVMYAFVSDKRKGGTENAIKWAKRYNKKVVIK